MYYFYFIIDFLCLIIILLAREFVFVQNNNKDVFSGDSIGGTLLGEKHCAEKSNHPPHRKPATNK